MGFRFYDTLVNEVRPFTPREEGVVRMYNCGPTVYDSQHIGNYRAATFADVLRRSLDLAGYEVHQVMNLTDVGHLTLDDIESGEDKMELAARREGRTAWEIAQAYIDEYMLVVEKMNWRRPLAYPRATDHVAEMIEITEALVASGHAYVTDAGNVYFSVASFPEYGKLSGNTVEALEAGSRVDVLDEKQHPADFALWKRDAEHQMQWDSPWGEGFPGWHIECSAMSRKYLGDELDIHTGGEDNVFPHHECEIAQSESFTGKTFVRHWMHTRHLQVDGGKMAKSDGTFITYEQVEARGHSMRALRYLLLSAHYRMPLNFTWDALAGAESVVDGLDATIRTLTSDAALAADPAVAERCAAVEAGFLAALQDDLNVSAALAHVHDLRGFVNKHGPFATADADRVRAAFAYVDELLGLDLLTQDSGADGDDAAEIDALVQERIDARASKNWARADEIRDELTGRGITVEDTPDGARWYR